MKKACHFVEFPASDATKLINWINRHFEKAEITVSPDAPRHLIDFCGSDMYILKGEIDKLCTICQNVSKDEIEKYCFYNKKISIEKNVKVIVGITVYQIHMLHVFLIL